MDITVDYALAYVIHVLAEEKISEILSPKRE